MGSFMLALFLVGVAAALVLLCLKVMPQKLDGTFDSKFMQFLHDYFNFKKLYIESVLKFVFALATVVCIVGGVVGILGAIFGFFSGIVEALDYGGWYFEYLVRDVSYTILSSLFTLVLGPVIVRLVYEFAMMFILLVKNTIEINNKLPEKKKEPEAPSDENQI